MLLGACSGAGGGAAGSGGSEPSSQAAPAGASSSGESVAGTDASEESAPAAAGSVTDAEAADDADEAAPVAVKILTQMFPTTINPSEMGMYKDIEQALNVRLEWETVPYDIFPERKGIILSSGELPDIFFAGLSDSDITTNSDLFLDMSAHLDKMPNVTAMFAQNRDIEIVSTFPPDGKIYSLPQVYGIRPTSAVTIAINQAWLDKLGLPMPGDLQEFEAALVAFKDGDPNGNGEADELPLDWMTDGHGHSIYAAMGGIWGQIDGCNEDMVYVDDEGNVGFVYEYDGFYKLTQYLHKWYGMGLISPEIYTSTRDQKQSYFSDGEGARVGVQTNWAPSGPFAGEYAIMPLVPEFKDSDAGMFFPTSSAQIQTNAVLINRRSEHIDKCVEIVNWFYSEDYSIQSQYGSFGDTTAKLADGSYEILQPADGDIEASKWKYSIHGYGPGNFSRELEKKTKAPAALTLRQEQGAVYEPWSLPPERIFPPVKYDEETSQEMAILQADIKPYVKQMQAKWCIDGGIEEDWDGYLATLKQMGIDEYRAIFQRAYDEAMSG
jgi:putative aldouronate transport system substrate-binding protein